MRSLSLEYTPNPEIRDQPLTCPVYGPFGRTLNEPLNLYWGADSARLSRRLGDDGDSAEQGASPTRLLAMLSDRCFGALEAIANSSIKLARVTPEEELAMDVLVAEAILEFADDLRTASRVASEKQWVPG